MGQGVVEAIVLNVFGFLDLICCSVADEDGLASPFDDDVLALGDRSEVNFDLGLSKHVGRGGHVD